MERFGKDPRSGSPPPGELSAGWAVPAAGSIGQIASLPDLVAALVALHGQSAPAQAQPAWPPGRLRAQGGALGPEEKRGGSSCRVCAKHAKAQAVGK